MESTLKQCISHIRKDDSGQVVSVQSNEDHSKGVANLARTFADAFDMGDWGYVMGLLHDKGKEKVEFQEYIQDVNGIAGHTHYTFQGKSHAYIGGLIARKLYLQQYPMIGNPLMGHHRGLYDYNDLIEEESKDIPQEVLIPNPTKVRIPSWLSPNIFQRKDFHHVERMLFSCLVDADYLDTERFMQPKQYLMRGSATPLKDLLPKLENYIAQFGTPTTDVNKIRHEVQQFCLCKSKRPKGMYSLTVPTGGGKTLSSLVWAMHHAVEHQQKRIIIAIPYTSIIVQTASILRQIFGDENVLEHHSNTQVDDSRDEIVVQQTKLATENWDYPIIVTTNVQLFESMMSNRPSGCRKLHNICDSVLILDEVQTLPIESLQPIVDTLDTYQRLFGVSVLFTTASQPVLTGVHLGRNPRVIFNGLSKVEELIPKEALLHDRLRRVALDIDNTPCSYDEVVSRLVQFDKVLCIVNTRRDAKELFDRLPKEGICIHLSRMMCPAHVSQKIEEMSKALENPENKIIRVISTQLIEAGVDIDFPTVFRQEAGLDSILQAAGRCNREGKLDISTTYVFSLNQEHTLPKGYISKANDARKNMGSNYDWFAPETMNDYFRQLFSKVDSFDKKRMGELLYDYENLQFETASNEFCLIEDETVSVVVNWEKSMSLIEQLKAYGPSYSLFKKLSRYSVSLRRKDFDQLYKSQIIQEVLPGCYVISEKNQYHKDMGLITNNQWLEETLIV